MHSTTAATTTTSLCERGSNPCTETLSNTSHQVPDPNSATWRPSFSSGCGGNKHITNQDRRDRSFLMKPPLRATQSLPSGPRRQPGSTCCKRPFHRTAGPGALPPPDPAPEAALSLSAPNSGVTPVGPPVHGWPQK